jgi:hypothetical protein
MERLSKSRRRMKTTAKFIPTVCGMRASKFLLASMAFYLKLTVRSTN